MTNQIKPSNISANTLFHFTNSISNIESILINEFHPKYCIEDLSIFIPKNIFDKKVKFAIPMVSFCDIPLSQIKQHIQCYGCYAIGLSKKWGIKKKISPVIYSCPESNSIAYLKNIISRAFQRKIKPGENACGFLDPVLESFGILYYAKAYREDIYKGKWHKDVIFYNEREWRFVPVNEYHRIDKSPEQVFQKPTYKKIYKKGFENKFSKFPLSFEPNDVKYIIVSKDSEILAMAKKIDVIRSKYSDKTKELLKTKIISLQKILEDF